MKIAKTLIQLSRNERALITGFSTKLSANYLTRLRELGFREGEFVTCLKTPPLGAPRVFEICGSVFSVESEIARECEIEIYPAELLSTEIQ
ncbi:MAG: FeoA family protein [Bdellovibrionota bacterium]